MVLHKKKIVSFQLPNLFSKDLVYNKKKKINNVILEGNTRAFWKDQPHASCDIGLKHHLAFHMYRLQNCRSNSPLSFTDSFSISWSELFLCYHSTSNSDQIYCSLGNNSCSKFIIILLTCNSHSVKSTSAFS